MISQAVIGCGYGDEGKGRVTSFLCSRRSNPLVVRFSGGQQAGHRVVWQGKDHIFSNFGSGTLQGCHTYWSQFCTVDPVGIINELDILLGKGANPVLFIDAKCPVTTPFEKECNKRENTINQHGSCGVGVNATLRREEAHYSFLAEDLLYPSVREIKLGLLQSRYGINLYDEVQAFMDYCDKLRSNERISITEKMPYGGYDAVIFEGSQGLLLDQRFGFFPHVTPSNTGTKNIIEMGASPEVFYVIRAYHTRHGNGPLTNENIPLEINNPHEHNISGNYQGEFRVAPLDVDLLKYAIAKDGYRSGDRKLVVTCLDSMSRFVLSIHGKLVEFKGEADFINAITDNIGLQAFTSREPYGPIHR